jgi:RNA polymerase sigma-70 factor (ECF subfamily)
VVNKISKNIATTGALQGNTWTLEHEKAQKKAKEREAQAANLDEVSDEDLMLVCQTGKTEALDEIYRRYYRPMLLFIVRLVQNRDLAEDLVQETFLRVYNNRHSWEPKSKFSSWIYRIARNLCIDEKRRYWNRLVHMDSQFQSHLDPEGNSSFLERVEDEGSDARDVYARKIDEEAIKRAINQLSEEQREVIILNKYQGLSYIEIAEILGATPESIKQRAYRAHLKLRQILEPMLREYA